MNYQSEQINELVAALSKAQGEMGHAVKNMKNSHFKNEYADLSAVIDAAREPLVKNGFAIIQTMDSEAGLHYLITTLAHKSGQWIKSKLPILCADNKPQSLGSAISYMRRYALSSIVGISQVDDDGESAEGRSFNGEAAKSSMISKGQLKELEELFSQCPPEFKAKMLTPLGISLEQLPVNLFDRLKLAAIKEKDRIDGSKHV